MQYKKRVLFIAEYLNPPYDEGIKKATYNLFKDLEQKYVLLAICRHGYDAKNISIIKTNALFLSQTIKDRIKNFNPDVIIYFPFASGTFASYLRLRVLQFFQPKTKFIFINLQNKPLLTWQKLIVRFIKPDVALSPSQELTSYWDSIKIKNFHFPLMTDLTKFKPLEDSGLKFKLREKYKIPKDAFIISHMGHLNETRNLRTLIPLQKGGFQIVVVGSSSTPIDSRGPISLKQDLESHGIIILDGYIKNIEEVYQLSDLYIFPVVVINGSISFPLSVLEARACSIPVLTTEYGSLKFFLGDDSGGIFYSEPEFFLENVKLIKSIKRAAFSKTMIPVINNTFYNIIFDQIDK